MLFVCHPKIFSFSWGHFNPQEKLETMLMQNFGVTNKEPYDIFCSGQLKCAPAKELGKNNLAPDECRHRDLMKHPIQGVVVVCLVLFFNCIDNTATKVIK